MEEWRDVVGYENYYKVSNYGSVASKSRYVNNNGSLVLKKEQMLKPCVVCKGYLQYDLYVEGKRSKQYAHRLVAQAFIPNPNDFPEVNHKDGDKTNNHVDNLEWVTKAENQKHAHDNKLLLRDECGRFKSVV